MTHEEIVDFVANWLDSHLPPEAKEVSDEELLHFIHVIADVVIAFQEKIIKNEI